MEENFRAIIIENLEGKPTASLGDLSMDSLPNYDVLVDVKYSSLNYKDALAITGKGRIARRLPMVPGIDLAGIVVSSDSPAWKPGDRVMANGWGMSETEMGAYTRYQRLKSEWLMPVPERFSLSDVMAIGTAGYTAALCVNALEAWEGFKPDRAPILVTGATGGVGSVAISLLSSKGYEVAALTGREGNAAYLRELGASTIVPRAEMMHEFKPLQKERWSGVVDSVGSTILANAIAQTNYGSPIAVCGMAAGADLNGSVFPHILRGVVVFGVDSVFAPMPKRERAWDTLVHHLDIKKLQAMTQLRALSEIVELSQELLAGSLRGRIVVDVSR